MNHVSNVLYSSLNDHFESLPGLSWYRCSVSVRYRLQRGACAHGQLWLLHPSVHLRRHAWRLQPGQLHSGPRGHEHEGLSLVFCRHTHAHTHTDAHYAMPLTSPPPPPPPLPLPPLRFLSCSVLRPSLLTRCLCWPVLGVPPPGWKQTVHSQERAPWRASRGERNIKHGLSIISGDVEH